MLLLVGAMLALASWKWGRDTWNRGMLLYHQRGCMRYVAPAEQVVFDSDPARVALLAKDANFSVMGGCAFRKAPGDWTALSAGTSAPLAGTGPAALLFLHERKNKSGVSRLVAVERTAAAGESAYFLNGYDVMPHILIPVGWKGALKEISFGYPIDVVDSVGPHTDIRIYAGQPDPADESHFTIRYERKGKVNVVDGYLDDRSGVTMTRRPEP